MEQFVLNEAATAIGCKARGARSAGQRPAAAAQGGVGQIPAVGAVPAVGGCGGVVRGGRKRSGLESFWSRALQRSPTEKPYSLALPNLRSAYSVQNCVHTSPLSSFQVSRPAGRLCAPRARTTNTRLARCLFAEPHVGSRNAESTPGGPRCPHPPQKGPSAPDSAQDADTATQENLFYSRFPKVAAARG